MAIVATAIALLAVLVLGIQAISNIAQGSRRASLLKGTQEEQEALTSDEDNGTSSCAPLLPTPSTSRPTPSIRLPYERCPSPGKGLGLFATQRIPKYARVLVEAPQFVTTPPIRSPSSPISSDLLERIQAGFDSLTPAEQGIYESCHEHRFPGEPDDGRLFYIFRSNAFGITPVDLIQDPRMSNDRMATKRAESTRWGMFPRMAQINHSCQPNVANLWLSLNCPDNADNGRVDHGFHVVWATRDISPGEEILISYVNILEDTVSRQRNLDQFGFLCNCRVCSQARSGNSSVDQRRVHTGALLRHIEDILVNEIKDTKGERHCRNSFNDMETLFRLLRSEDESLAGYLPRTYRLAAALIRLATDDDIAVYGQRLQAWITEEETLVYRLLSADRP